MYNPGHILKIRNPNKPEQWIDIPVLYQTMYQAYKSYCEANNIPENSILDERAYYITLGTLKDIADTMTGYAGTIPLESGGTGTSVSDLSGLLAYLGLITSITNAADKFPTSKAVKTYVDTEVSEAKEELKEFSDGSWNEFYGFIADGDLSIVGITSGTTNPNSNTEGVIYIKYSE